MNCVECREQMVAWIEGLLGPEQMRECQAHVDGCAACGHEYAAVGRVQQRLIAGGRAAAEVSVAESVMRRVMEGTKISETPDVVVSCRQQERETFMTRLMKHRWSFGFGAVAAGAAVLMFLLLPAPRAQATAAQVLARGARAVAKLTSIHLKGQLRTAPADNFGSIDVGADFSPIELWKQLAPERKWRVEKPGRVAVMDGASTTLYIKVNNVGYRLPQATPGGAFDTAWLDRIANLSTTIENELKNAQAKGWKLGLREERGTDGRNKSVVTVEANSGLPEDDYLKNKFFENADTRRVYRFDTQSELLEGVQVFVVGATNHVLVFELTQIEYNQAINPAVFRLELPDNVGWVQEFEVLPDNEKYAAMTAEEAARAFFEACSKNDWTEAQKFEKTPVNDRLKKYLGGLKLVSLGTAFTSQAADPSARFVPYEIKLQAQEINVRVSTANAAKRSVVTGFLDLDGKVLQDFMWSTEPEQLAADDPYAKMTPAQVAEAYFDCMRKQDWVGFAKIASPSDVEKTKQQCAEAQKRGIDIRNMLPDVKAGEAAWSAEHSATLVRCQLSSVKKWNLALKKDPKTGRWSVDGGI